MTVTELKEYTALKAEVRRCKEKLSELNKITLSSPKLGFDSEFKSPALSNSTENAIIEMIAKKEDYQNRINTALKQIARIEAYINNIKNRRTKMIFEMRIYDQKEWWRIAAEFGGRNSDESVQKIFSRYVRNNPNG